MIEAEFNQTLVTGSRKIPMRLVNTICRQIERTLSFKKDVKISIAFVSRERMRALNKMYRGKDRATDVLAFALEEGACEGEVLVNYHQAQKQAAQMRHSVRQEILFLIVHGILHVLGHDHKRAQDAKIMFGIQERILDTLKIDSRL